MLGTTNQIVTSSFRCSGRTTSAAFVGALACFLLSYPGVASASPAFPTALREAAGLDCTPVCSVCHTTDPGTSGTASKPFALAMRDAGLEAGDESTVASAFEVLDPDGDGVPEFEGGDTSGAAGATGTTAFPCQAEVKYGCGVTSSAPQTPSGTAYLLLAGLLALGVSLRRRLVGNRASRSV